MRATPTRRGFSRLLAGAGLAALAAACSRPPPGPRPIKLGRDVCEHCNMIISELRFAAQTWDKARHRPVLFDEIGCAVAFAAYEDKLKQPDFLIWAADAANPDPKNPALWLDARTASYKDGFRTPMDYGYAAAPAGVWPLSYEAMAEGVRRKALCLPQSAT